MANRVYSRLNLTKPYRVVIYRPRSWRKLETIFLILDINVVSAFVNPVRVCYSLSVKIRDVIKLIEDDGWFLVATRGSHRQYKHMSKAGRVTIAGHPGDDVSPGTLNSVRKQAQLEKGE